MNKKQTIRRLGSIENTQTKQTKQPAQKPKKLNKEIELESDNDIENYPNDDLDDINLDDMVDDKPTKYNMKPKKKRVISDEQKKVLTDRLAYARSLRKKEADNKKVLENEYLKRRRN